ncbi:MAG: hypothetical protein U5K99_07570 [Anaerolineales bacterium]|nr:hypothetical protein [Anaerolineales bacterium]
MVNLLFKIMIILHGLVHFWYVTLGMGWVDFQSEMGWTGKSWLLSGFMSSDLPRVLAVGFYGISAVLFSAAGLGMILGFDVAQKWLWVPALISAAAVVIFWDGQTGMLVEKGVLGLMISLGLAFYSLFL